MRLASLALGLVLCLGLLSDHAAADHHEMAGPKASAVWIMDPAGNVGQLLQFTQRAAAIAEKAGGKGKQRVFSVAFGGPTSDHVVVVVEFPSMAALGDSFTKVGASPEWQKLAAEVRAAGIRLVSRSVMVEIGK